MLSSTLATVSSAGRRLPSADGEDRAGGPESPPSGRFVARRLVILGVARRGRLRGRHLASAATARAAAKADRRESSFERPISAAATAPRIRPWPRWNDRSAPVHGLVPWRAAAAGPKSMDRVPRVGDQYVCSAHAPWAIRRRGASRLPPDSSAARADLVLQARRAPSRRRLHGEDLEPSRAPPPPKVMAGDSGALGQHQDTPRARRHRPRARRSRVLRE